MALDDSRLAETRKAAFDDGLSDTLSPREVRNGKVVQ